MVETEIRTYAGFSFSWALTRLKEGKKVKRVGWSGKGMFLVLVPNCSYQVAAGLCDNTKLNPCNPALSPWIGLKTEDDSFFPWLASQTDMLSNDWLVAE